jgi:hypothetical protein
MNGRVPLKLLVCSFALCFVWSGCPCDPRFYCDKNKCSACPLNSISSHGSLRVEDCYCLAGYSGVASGPCSLCSVGKFKESAGNGSCLPCIANPNSPAGSTNCTTVDATKLTADLNEKDVARNPAQSHEPFASLNTSFKLSREHTNSPGVKSDKNVGEQMRLRANRNFASVCFPGTYQQHFALLVGNEPVYLNLDTYNTSKVGPLELSVFRFSSDGQYLVAIQSNGGIGGGGISRVDLPMLRITAIAGGSAGSSWGGAADGYGTRAQFDGPTDLAISKDGTFAIISDHTGYDGTTRCRIRKIDLATNLVRTIAGGRCGSQDGVGSDAQFLYPLESVSMSLDGTFALTSAGGWLRKVNLITLQVTTVSPDLHQGVSNIRLSPDGAFALYYTNRYDVCRISLPSESFSTLAGGGFGYADGVGSNARFGHMSQLTMSPTGTYALIVDSNPGIRRLDIVSKTVSTIKAGLSFVSWLDISGCSFCEVGTAAQNFGAFSCTPCKYGTYQSEIGMSVGTALLIAERQLNAFSVMTHVFWLLSHHVTP